MKITDMTREELRDYMRDITHEIGLPDGRYRFNSESPTWKYAFKLIRKSGYENLDIDCAKCVSKVNEWLIK